MSDTIRTEIETTCRNARRAARELSRLDDRARSDALRRTAARLRAETARIGAANDEDLAAARETGLTSALLDRLTLTPERINAMAGGLETVAALPDPLADSIAEWTAPAGLHIRQVRIPIGVIAVIYESRPNVTADVAALCVKSGNAVALKGGKEAIRSNAIIADLITEELTAAGIPPAAVQLIRSTDREATWALLAQEEHVDVVIPRGGPGLVRAIAEHSKVPVIKHYEGVCTTYVDEHADLGRAAEITFNAKVQRPGVCNAMENLVVHDAVARPFLEAMGPRFENAGVELRGCERTRAILASALPASEDDWSSEYLDLILAVKIVDSVEDAVDFINEYGSGHSDAIVTADDDTASSFLTGVDSAVVYQNASTRFTDGFEFGFGAEIGISTNRIHARGPMGLRELTTYKYVVHGTGQIR
ncbi:MAG: glutamate-5-semialdehyde dehydrogenase [Candidatus Binatia bacterium]